MSPAECPLIGRNARFCRLPKQKKIPTPAGCLLASRLDQGLVHPREDH